MKRFLAATLLMCMATPVQGEDKIDEFEAFGSYLENFRKETGTPSLSAVIVRDGAIVWEGYFGTYDDEGDLPTVAGTTYKIASVTKPIAATRRTR